uniref:Evasin n=1 Tax=Amblyomma cajennense TaxID=34607 RepID=A0A023FE15_AMBCJ
MKTMLYTLFCYTLLAFHCFALPHDSYPNEDVRSPARIKTACPSATTLVGESGEMPVGCVCGGKLENLPQGTRCYVGLESLDVWMQGKFGPNDYRCPVGKCNNYGKCESVGVYEKCNKTMGKPK